LGIAGTGMGAIFLGAAELGLALALVGLGSAWGLHRTATRRLKHMSTNRIALCAPQDGYLAKVQCWNCQQDLELLVPKGMTVVKAISGASERCPYCQCAGSIIRREKGGAT